MKRNLLLVISSLLILSLRTFSQPGTLNTAFGNSGHVVADFSAQNRNDESATKVLVQTDGKRVVVFDRYPYIQAIRYNADGTPDATFGEGGFSQAINLSVFSGGRGCNAALQADGKIVVTGETRWNNTTMTDFGLARLNTNGTLDASFGNNGIATTDFGYWEDAYCLSLLPDGRILIGGMVRINNVAYMGFARYNTNGSLDANFGFGGKHVNPIFSGISMDDMELAPDGKIVVLADDFGNRDYTIARFNSNGPIDNSFTGDGYEGYDFGNINAGMSALEVQPDGKILVGGFNYNGVNSDLAVARHNIDGSFDLNFHGDGKQTTHIGGSEMVFDIGLQPDGKIVVVGNVYYGNSMPSLFAAARYLSNGNLDGTFGVQGTQITGFSGYQYASAASVVIHLDGKITAAGTAARRFNGDIAVATYDVNGIGDQDGYPVQRIITFYGDNGATSFRTAAVQTDGKLLVGGYAWNGVDYDFLLARYNANGTLDANFGNGGFLLSGFGDEDDDFINAIAIQSDGKIVATGAHQSGLDVGFPIARYNPDGTLDATFDGDGMTLINLPGSFDEGHAIIIQPDGKIVIGGETNTADFDFAVCRLNAGGSLDGSFGTGGIVTTNTGYQDIIFDMVLQPDGKILATGNTSPPNSLSLDYLTVRYNTDGSLDASFGTGGKVQTDFGNRTDFAGAILLQPDGKIIVGGGVSRLINPNLQDFDFGLVRYNADGSLDAGFGNGGKQTTDFTGYDIGSDLALQTDGKILLVGWAEDWSEDDFNKRVIDIALARYNQDGTLNDCFGTLGKVTSDFGGQELGFATAIAGDNIFVAGRKRIFREFTATDKYFGIAAAYNRTGGAVSLKCKPNGPVIVNTNQGTCSAIVNDPSVDPLTCPDDATPGSIKYEIKRNNLVVATGAGSVRGKEFSLGQSTVTYSLVSDPSKSCSFIVEVKDDEAPTITCPATQTLSLGQNCSAPLPDYRSLATAKDNCTPSNAITVQQTPAPGTVVSGLGSLTVNLLPTDASGNSAATACTFTVNKVDNTGPSITCPANVTVNAPAGSCSAVVSNSTIGNATAIDNCSNTVTVSHSPFPQGNVFPVGTTNIVWTAMDGDGNTSACTQTVTVLDMVPPVISNASVNPSVLDKPNHKMVNVAVTYSVSDNCPNSPAPTLSVSSNEPVAGTNGADQSPDWVIVDNHLVQLRAERDPKGDGRVYTITINASDASGNLTTTTRTVVVPKGNNSNNRVPGNMAEQVITLEASVRPNPSNNKFKLVVKSSNEEAITMKVTDIYGRVIERRNVMNNQELQLGDNYRPGTYMIHVIQGKESRTLKLIKLSN